MHPYAPICIHTYAFIAHPNRNAQHTSSLNKKTLNTYLQKHKIFIRNEITALESMIEEHRSDAELSGVEMTAESAKFFKEQEKELELIKKRHHKLKGDNPYEGEQDTFIVPDGIRLVFLSKSLTTITVNTDKFLFKPEFYTNSLIDRDSYESISPITLFSTIKNNPNGSVSKIDICKFLNNKA